MAINSSKSKTGLLTVLQQDQDLRPSWNTYHLRWSGEKGVM
jgi:negative regulator of sigma E activity